MIGYGSVGVIGGGNQRCIRAGYEQVKDVARVVSREGNMLGEVESVQKV